MVRGLALLADHAISKSRNLGDFWLRRNMLLASVAYCLRSKRDRRAAGSIRRVALG